MKNRFKITRAEEFFFIEQNSKNVSNLMIRCEHYESYDTSHSLATPAIIYINTYIQLLLF